MGHEEISPEPTSNLPAQGSVPGAGRGRSDGWTPDRMATFLEILADTGLVTEACRAAGMNRGGVYALRHRNPVFGAAWAAADALARPIIADGLLERAITGTVEHYYRDGVLVGERRHYESWLGLAVLKRLDRQAEEDRADACLAARMTGDWPAMLQALREGGTAAVPALFDPEIDKVDTPPSPPGCDPFDQVWRKEDSWMTSHAPPPGFAGWESGIWDGEQWYERACTAEESALLDAHAAAMIAQERRELTQIAERERDSFFDRLSREIAAVAALAALAPDCDGSDAPLDPAP